MDVWQVNKSLVINTVKNMPEHGSSFQEVFCKKAVYKNFAKFIGGLQLHLRKDSGTGVFLLALKNNCGACF